MSVAAVEPELLENAVYARLSRLKAGDDMKVDDQLSLAVDWLELRDEPGPIVTYVDNGKSASRFAKKPRLDFDKLAAKLRDRRVRSITVVEPSRMWRQPVELEAFLTLLDEMPKDHRVKLFVVSDDTELVLNAAGRKMLRYRVTDAAAESDTISERVLRRRGANRKRGTAHGGKRPFGYERVWRLDDQGRPVASLEIVESEAKLIRDAVTHLLANGSQNDIIRQWVAAGISHARLHGVLRSPRIAGLVPRNDEPFGTASWTPIISPERWHRLQTVIDARKLRTPQKRRSLLTGVLICGNVMPDGTPCRAQLWSMWRDGRRKRICSRRYPGDRACNGVSVFEQPVIDLVTEALFHVVERADFAEIVAQYDADRGDAALLLGELADTQSELDAIPAQVGAKRLTVTLASAIECELIARQTSLRKRLSDALAASPLEPYIGRPGALRAAWEADALSDDQRRTILLAVFGQIAILPVGKTAPRTFNPERVVLASRFTRLENS